MVVTANLYTNELHFHQCAAKSSTSMCQRGAMYQQATQCSTQTSSQIMFGNKPTGSSITTEKGNSTTTMCRDPVFFINEQKSV